MDKQRYLSEEESARCRMVTDAFTELYELDDIAVVDAGRFGFGSPVITRPAPGLTIS